METFYIQNTALESGAETHKNNTAPPELKSTNCVEQIKSWFTAHVNAHFTRLSDLRVYDSYRGQ